MAAKKIMILWSGGIDSTAILKSYLEKTDYEIFATKIIYNTQSESILRIVKEKQAIEKLLPKLLKIRSFHYNEIIVEYPNVAMGTDVPIFGTLAIYPAYTFGCTEIVIGYVSDIRTEQLKYVLQKNEVLTLISKLFFENSKNIWKWYPKFTIPIYYNTKMKYIEILGDLVKDVWFCRFPKLAENTNGCGKCVACQHVKRSLPQLIEL